MPDWILALIVALAALVYVVAQIRLKRAGVQFAKVKMPPRRGLAVFAVLWIFTAANIWFFHLHGTPAGGLWFFLVVLTVAIAIVCRMMMRQPEQAP